MDSTDLVCALAAEQPPPFDEFAQPLDIAGRLARLAAAALAEGWRADYPSAEQARAARSQRAAELEKQFARGGLATGTRPDGRPHEYFFDAALPVRPDAWQAARAILARIHDPQVTSHYLRLSTAATLDSVLQLDELARAQTIPLKKTGPRETLDWLLVADRLPAWTAAKTEADRTVSHMEAHFSREVQRAIRDYFRPSFEAAASALPAAAVAWLQVDAAPEEAGRAATEFALTSLARGLREAFAARHRVQQVELWHAKLRDAYHRLCRLANLTGHEAPTRTGLAALADALLQPTGAPMAVPIENALSLTPGDAVEICKKSKPCPNDVKCGDQTHRQYHYTDTPKRIPLKSRGTVKEVVSRNRVRVALDAEEVYDFHYTELSRLSRGRLLLDERLLSSPSSTLRVGDPVTIFRAARHPDYYYGGSIGVVPIGTKAVIDEIVSLEKIGVRLGLCLDGREFNTTWWVFPTEITRSQPTKQTLLPDELAGRAYAQLQIEREARGKGLSADFLHGLYGSPRTGALRRARRHITHALIEAMRRAASDSTNEAAELAAAHLRTAYRIEAKDWTLLMAGDISKLYADHEGAFTSRLVEAKERAAAESERHARNLRHAREYLEGFERVETIIPMQSSSPTPGE